MPQQNHQIGDSFRIQFVWQIPNNDYIRAIFQADIIGLDTVTERYIIQLTSLIAKRQESDEGKARPLEQMSPHYWPMVESLIAHKAAVAYETTDQRPVRLRLQTLTGEHSYFTKYT